MLPSGCGCEMFLQSMSEFKYACPVCGQHIQCDSSQAGTQMECPTCFQKIIAPQAPARSDIKLMLTGIKTVERPAVDKTSVEPKKGIAPLIYALLGVVIVIVIAIAAV